MIPVKPFLTYDQQIEYLVNAGLLIEDKERAKNILSTLNYYRFINAYSLGLYEAPKEKKKYIAGTTFQQIYDLYLFDGQLRHILSELLEEFEIIFRTKLAYHIGLKYGALGYLDSTLFENKYYHDDFIKSFKREQEQQDKSPIVKHHKEKYDCQMPIWAAVEILSFGTISKLYSNMKTSDRIEIAKELGTSYTYLNSWLRSFVEVRNICAHYGRLYNKFLLFPPKLYGNMSFANNRIFAVIYILKRFVDDSVWDSLYARLKATVENHYAVNLGKIGFPVNWDKLLM